MVDVVQLLGRGGRGESQADILRRTGQYGVLPTDSDQVVINKMVDDISASTMATSNLFPDATAGLAATIDGEYFSVPAPAPDDVFLILYQNGGGTAVEINRYPSASNVVTQPQFLTALREDEPFESTFDPSDPDTAGIILNGAADLKNFDVFQINFTMKAGYVGNGVHVMSIAESGVSGGQSIGGAMNGPGTADALVGNRYEAGSGNGVTGARVGSGAGNGVEGRCSTTAAGSAGYFVKQNPVSGVCGSGPGAWLVNNGDNGEAFHAQSSANNVEGQTAIIDRLNGTQGTAQLVRVIGTGTRTALVRGTASQIAPSAASTGSPSVIAHDVQINANVSGSADVRGININNSATSGTEAYGMVAIVDGANTTNYGLFLNAANGGSNYAFYSPNGLIRFGGGMQPLTDGDIDLGGGGARMGTIYAATGTINTSDAREKNWRGALTDAHLRAAKRIGQVMGLYQWLDQVAEKGEDGARVHFGVKAQDVIGIFYDEGLEQRPAEGERPSFRHAFLCYDEWEDEYVPVMDGDRISGQRLAIAAGNRFGIRVDQLALFLIAAQEARLARLEDRGE